MKKLANAKTRTIFETSATVFDLGKDRQVIVEAHPMYAVVRLRRQKRSYCVSWEALWHLGARAASDLAMKERLHALKARRALQGATKKTKKARRK
jgi:hypothetical protein